MKTLNSFHRKFQTSDSIEMKKMNSHKLNLEKNVAYLFIIIHDKQKSKELETLNNGWNWRFIVMNCYYYDLISWQKRTNVRWYRNHQMEKMAHEHKWALLAIWSGTMWQRSVCEMTWLAPISLMTLDLVVFNGPALQIILKLRQNMPSCDVLSFGFSVILRPDDCVLPKV